MLFAYVQLFMSNFWLKAFESNKILVCSPHGSFPGLLYNNCFSSRKNICRNINILEVRIFATLNDHLRFCLLSGRTHLKENSMHSARLRYNRKLSFKIFSVYWEHRLLLGTNLFLDC